MANLRLVAFLVVVGVPVLSQAQKAPTAQNVNVVNPSTSPANVRVLNTTDSAVPVTITNSPEIVIGERGTRFQTSFGLSIAAGQNSNYADVDPAVQMTVTAISALCRGVDSDRPFIAVVSGQPVTDSSPRHYFASQGAAYNWFQVVPYTNTRIPDVARFEVGRGITTGTTSCTVTITGYRL